MKRTIRIFSSFFLWVLYGISVLVGQTVGGTISSNPSNATACVGGSISFTVTTNCTPPNCSNIASWVYSWMLDGVLINNPNQSPYSSSGGTSGTLTINPLDIGFDNKSISCIVIALNSNSMELARDTTDEILLTVNSGPTIALSSTDLDLCKGGPEVTITFSVSGGPLASLSWSSGTPLIFTQLPDSSIQINTNRSPGTYSVLFAASDTNGCTFHDTVTIDILSAPNPAVAPDVELCIGDNIQIGEEDNTSFTYSWAPSTWLNDPSLALPTLTHGGNSSGSFDYTVTVESASGCTATDEITVTILDPPVIDSVTVTDPTECDVNDGIVVIHANSPSGKDLRYRIPGSSIWKAGNQFSGLPAGSGVVQVSYNGLTNIGCLVEASVTLKNPEAPTASIETPLGTLCLNDTLTELCAASEPGASYTWEVTSGVPSSDTSRCSGPFYFNSDGTKEIKLIVERAGCENSVSDSITILPLPNPEIDPPDEYCEQDFSINLNQFVNSGSCESTEWDLPATPMGDFDLNDPIDTTVTFICIDVNGCEAQGELPIIVNPIPEFQYTPDTIGPLGVCLADGEMISQYVSISGPNMTWETIGPIQNIQMDSSGIGSPDGLLLNLNDTRYGGVAEILMHIEEASCTNTDSFKVSVVPEPIFIPDLFTPNADGVNDTWSVKIPGDGVLSQYSIRVFNRSGATIIPETSLENFLWTGEVNGRPCPRGSLPIHCFRTY